MYFCMRSFLIMRVICSKTQCMSAECQSSLITVDGTVCRVPANYSDEMPRLHTNYTLITPAH